MFWLKVLGLVPRPLMCLLIYLFAERLIARAKLTPYFDLPGYMNRWWLYQEVRFLGHTWSVRIHETLRSDLDRHLHDHPYDNASIVLANHYIEVTPMDRRKDPGGFQGRIVNVRTVGDVIVRAGADSHQLILNGPALSLFICLKEHKRKWGFYTEGGWVYWKRYVDPSTLAPEELAELDHAEPAALALR